MKNATGEARAGPACLRPSQRSHHCRGQLPRIQNTTSVHLPSQINKYYLHQTAYKPIKRAPLQRWERPLAYQDNVRLVGARARLANEGLSCHPDGVTEKNKRPDQQRMLSGKVTSIISANKSSWIQHSRAFRHQQPHVSKPTQHRPPSTIKPEHKPNRRTGWTHNIWARLSRPLVVAVPPLRVQSGAEPDRLVASVAWKGQATCLLW